MRNTCCVADQFCTAPANYENANARAKCFVCGQPVCAKCSSIRKYLQFGRVRMCNDCQVEYDESEVVVMRRMYKLANS